MAIPYYNTIFFAYLLFITQTRTSSNLGIMITLIVLAIRLVMLRDPGRFIMVITPELATRGGRTQMQIFAVEQ